MHSDYSYSQSSSASKEASDSSKARKYESAFQQTIYLKGDVDPEVYIRELIQVYSGRPLRKNGSGANAVVYNGGDDSVFKMGNASSNSEYLAYFSRWSRQNANPFFPEVYWSAMVIGGYSDEVYYVIQMEKLIESYSKRADKWAQKFYRGEPEELIEKISDCIEDEKGVLWIPETVGSPPQAFYEARDVIRDVYTKLGDENEYVCFDLHAANFMFRPDGQIVFTDPLN